MNVRARRSEATAKRIRGVALKRFLSRSYDEVTLAEIAEAAGVTVPTLIAHFGRKGDLFVAAGEDFASRVVESREEAPVGDHVGAVRKLIESYDAEGKLILHLLAEEDRFPAVPSGDQQRQEISPVVGRASLRAEPEAPPRCTEREQLVVQLIVATDHLPRLGTCLSADRSAHRGDTAPFEFVLEFVPNSTELSQTRSNSLD